MRYRRHTDPGPSGRLADKDVLRHLLEFLAYEHSSFDGADLDGHGRFGYRYLDHYWTDHDRHPYLITAGGRIAGMHWSGRARPI